MKTTVAQIKAKLSGQEIELKRLGVHSLHIFGSVAQGRSQDSSDIDFLVEFDRPVGMFDFLEVKYFLEDLLKAEVDLATSRALHPRLRDGILKEAVRVA